MKKLIQGKNYIEAVFSFIPTYLQTALDLQSERMNDFMAVLGYRPISQCEKWCIMAKFQTFICCYSQREKRI